MYIKRHLEAVLSEIIKQYPCVLLSGPRQVGKTTLVKHLSDTARRYVTLDDLEIREIAKNDPKGFLQRFKPPICIDEIQYAPELFPYIKIHVDSNQRAGDFILTGSQIYRLMRGVSESLAGRIAILNMQGFSQSESLELANRPFLPDFNAFMKRKLSPVPDMVAMFERIFKGSMPAVVTGQYPDPARFYSAYLSTYLQRDVRDISRGIDELKFAKFLTAAACRTAQILNAAEMARDADIDSATAANWLNILETLGIIFYIHPYSNNLLKRTVKKPKLYFYDTGLVSYLCKWQSAQTLMVGAQAGAVLETYVVSEIVKSYYNDGREPFIYYYRDTDAKEIDILLEQDGKLFPIEIKKSVSADKRDAKAFSVISKSGLIQGTGAVISFRDTFLPLSPELLLVPIAFI
jgi:predicted AAA+ superfamily ATPase